VAILLDFASFTFPEPHRLVLLDLAREGNGDSREVECDDQGAVALAGQAPACLDGDPGTWGRLHLDHPRRSFSARLAAAALLALTG